MDADEIADGRRRFEDRWTKAAPFRQTLSGAPLQPLYAPDDLGQSDVPGFERIGWPGEYPFTRGIYTSGYLGKPWTIRQFAGFAAADDTNARFHGLLAAGSDGLSVAFDMPTLMGLDSDHPRAQGEVGHCGVAIDSAQDMDALFTGIPLDAVSTSMTISGPAVPLFCCYVVAAERAGADVGSMSGTLQTDIFKEYIAQKEWLYPPAPHLRLIGDLLEWTQEHLPRYHPISISGYHIREAGATAAQELAFTLADGFGYVELGIERGLDVDEFASRLSFFFDAHIDFFEEVAKFRAARRIWARWMRDRYGATTDRAQWLRFHTQTAGVSLTAQQPQNNVVRTAVEALAAVLGGTNSLHTNSLDEALALPTKETATIALRTQQIIAHESGVTNVVDPLGGSYFVEKLTRDMELGTLKYWDTIDRMGGMVEAIELGYPQKEIAEASYQFHQAVERREKIIVGVNDYVQADEKPIEILYIDDTTAETQLARLAELKRTRDSDRVQRALDGLRQAARGRDNTMPPLLECVRAYATVGEMCDALRDVWGEYEEVPVI
jgi:methylmalonyl-CoA mutase N-terminal domain/subunit